MPLAAFFAQFASFSFNENQSSNKNFDRLIKVMRITTEDPVRREVREGFKDALVQEFNERFGTDGNKFSNWQNLCNVLRIVPVPDTIQGCREVCGYFNCCRRVAAVAEVVCVARLGYPCQPRGPG
jgi:hypothetical protein